MLEALISGMLAGYGIAIPVGAIAVLIVGVGMKNGFAASASAGAGAATADLLYASVAVVAGGATAAVLERHSAPIRYLSVAVLIVIAVAGLAETRRPLAADGAVGVERGHLPGVYARFVGLTVINPLTVIYFTTVVIGSGLAADLEPGEGIAFALAAFAASLSWQLLLAGLGSVAGHRLSPRFRVYSVVAGNILILGFAVRILLGG